LTELDRLSELSDEELKKALKWVDKKKALDYFSVSAPLAEAQNNQELISIANIIQNFPNPKIEARNSLITPRWMLPTLMLWSVAIWLLHSVW
jgi:hypothetical protein